MRRAAVTLLVLVVACAARIAPNRYGLQVVPDLATYERLAKHDPDKRLVDLESLGIPIDIRYATSNNFMHKPLYPVAKAFLRAPAARARCSACRATSRRAGSA